MTGTNTPPPTTPTTRPGLLHGVRVVELASDRAAFAGKLFGDFGAAVTLIEPPGGHATRTYHPFLDDIPGPDRSLWFWHYNTSKAGCIADLTTIEGRERFAALAAEADVVLEAEDPGDLAALGINRAELLERHPRLVWTSVTPYGSEGPRSEPATDLTLLAGGGIAWNNGYDDHTLPPVRGSGNQAMHTASLYAVMATLTALVHRDTSGLGQFVDVNMHAAINVTTEAGSYDWLINQGTVQRQTCRHAAVTPSVPVLAEAADGRLVHTGVPPRAKREFEGLLRWLRDASLDQEFGELFFLEMGVERGGVHISEFASNPEALAIFGAGRDAVLLLSSRLTAAEFFRQGQQHGIAVGIVNAPEDVMGDPHVTARGFPTPVHHHEIGRTFTYPGLPFTGTAAGGTITRAPLLERADLPGVPVDQR